MAERRMFTRSVVYERLTECSHGAQTLYFHLNMQADDDGFVGNPKSVLRLIRCSRQHQRELVSNGLLIGFDSGPVVITHWLLHNKIRRDRYHTTIYQQEKQRLTVTENGAYCLTDDSQTTTNGQPDDNHLATQDRIGKDRLGKDRLDEDRPGVQKVVRSVSSSQIDFENAVLQLYAQHCRQMPPCTQITTKLRTQLEQLQAEGWTPELLEPIFQEAGQLPFLNGQGELGWRADLAWLCMAENLQKVQEGRYSPWKAPTTAACTLGQEELEAIQKLLRSEP